MFTVVCKGGLRTKRCNNKRWIGSRVYHALTTCCPIKSGPGDRRVTTASRGLSRHHRSLLFFQQSLNKMTSTENPELTPEETLAIDCTGLTYAFAEGLESALDGVDLQLKKGDRCLVVGANGGM